MTTVITVNQININQVINAYYSYYINMVEIIYIYVVSGKRRMIDFDRL